MDWKMADQSNIWFHFNMFLLMENRTCLCCNLAIKDAKTFVRGLKSWFMHEFGEPLHPFKTADLITFKYTISSSTCSESLPARGRTSEQYILLLYCLCWFLYSPSSPPSPAAVSTLVVFDLWMPSESFVTNTAFKGLLLGVQGHMCGQIRLFRKPFTANRAAKWFLSSMNSHVVHQRASQTKTCVANWAGERLLPCMNS